MPMQLNMPKFDGILNFIMLTDRAGKKGNSLYITTENKAKINVTKMPINKNKLFKTNSVTY